MKLIIANLKMNLSLNEIIEYKNSIQEPYKNLIIAPPYIYLDIMKSNNYAVASQNGYHIDKGAYTGEVSFKQLKNLGINYSMIGHSERRQKFYETNDIVKEKFISAVNNNIIPILCIGETKEERLSNRVNEVIEEQLKIVFDNVKVENTIIAYEPVWAIGTGLTPTLKEINDVHIHIREFLKKYNIKTQILYGGSVNENNIKEFSKSNNIDGFLIGSASLDPKNLIRMIKETM